MRRGHLLMAVACATYTVAWFVPVHQHGIRMPDGVPGWEAFRVATSPIWPNEGSGTQAWPLYEAALSVCSAATNLVMLGSAFAVLLYPRLRLLVAFGVAALLAVAVNSHWYILDKTSDLRVGYFLWWLAFLPLTAGLFALSRVGLASQSLRPNNEMQRTKPAQATELRR
jgi:hypothetical protein